MSTGVGIRGKRSLWQQGWWLGSVYLYQQGWGGLSISTGVGVGLYLSTGVEGGGRHVLRESNTDQERMWKETTLDVCTSCSIVLIHTFQCGKAH